jgi:hypothetical protein
MAMEVLQWGGYLDGDLKLDPTSADYVAGQPAMITAAGVKLAIAPADYLGMFKEDRSLDNKQGLSAVDAPVTSDLSVTVVCGTNKVRLARGTLAAGTTQTPFVFPGSAHAWVEGDQVFINGAGRWDNAAATGGDAAFGRVTKAPVSATDEMFVYMYR